MAIDPTLRSRIDLLRKRAQTLLSEENWLVHTDGLDNHIDLGGFSLIPTRVRVPALVHREVDGWQLVRWDHTYSPEWGDDVDEVPMGEYRTLAAAVTAALVWVLETELHEGEE